MKLKLFSEMRIKFLKLERSVSCLRHCGLNSIIHSLFTVDHKCNDKVSYSNQIARQRQHSCYNNFDQLRRHWLIYNNKQTFGRRQESSSCAFAAPPVVINFHPLPQGNVSITRQPQPGCLLFHQTMSRDHVIVIDLRKQKKPRFLPFKK